MKLGEFIHNYRIKNKLTMQDFANKAGLSKGYISMLEKNQHPQSRRQLTPSLETYQKIATAANLTLDELISVLDGNEMVSMYNDETDESREESSLVSGIANLLQDKSYDVQNDALILMECFVECDTYNRGKILAYAQGISEKAPSEEEAIVQKYDPSLHDVVRDQLKVRKEYVDSAKSSVPAKKSV